MRRLAQRLGEPLLLTRALARARAIPAEHADRARALGAAARRRAAAAAALRNDEQAIAALRLDQEAAGLALAAVLAQRGELGDETPPVSVLWSGAAALSDPPPNFPAACAILSNDDPVAADARGSVGALRARREIAPTLRWLLALAEPRSARELVVTRVFRVIALALCTAAAAWLALWLFVWPSNEALHKPVVMSSLVRGAAPTATLTDGAESGEASTTVRQADPWARIDLMNHVAIESVRVHVRAETSRPLLLEVSDDDRKFTEVARRIDAVGTGRWRVVLGKKRARFVRLRHPGEGVLSVSEIEVWGWR
jgi:hypothetical protein